VQISHLENFEHLQEEIHLDLFVPPLVPSEFAAGSNDHNTS
jgi:hypothetical protein